MIRIVFRYRDKMFCPYHSPVPGSALFLLEHGGAGNNYAQSHWLGATTHLPTDFVSDHLLNAGVRRETSYAEHFVVESHKIPILALLTPPALGHTHVASCVRLCNQCTFFLFLLKMRTLLIPEGIACPFLHVYQLVRMSPNNLGGKKSLARGANSGSFGSAGA